ncbi:MAG: hypothetical protein RLZZ342_68 [Candidatus Parcubacteria bacterium]|jgi:SAM-dependent methyltransferase
MTQDTYYASRFVPDATRSVVWKEIVRFLAPYIPAQATVVDLGAGYCDFINEVSAEKKYAVDISPELSTHAGATVITLNDSASNLSGIASNSVDVVHASNFLEHIDDAALPEVMGEIKRILKNHGTLILLQPNFRLAYKRYFDDPTHRRIWTDAGLEAFLVGEGFEITLSKPRFLPFSLRSRPSLVPAHPLIVRAYIHSPWKPFAGQMLVIARKK